jgi:16S rRNA (guanine966-N2)-methyltransferase
LENIYLAIDMLRISSGTAKNKRLLIPEIEGFRGVQEKAKMALFSIIGEGIKGSTCLDLFAGSGNLGLEALSRGAAWCDFVDEEYICVGAIEANIHNCGFVEVSQAFRKNAVKYVSNCQKKYGLIFMDPFYSDIAQKHLLKLLPSVMAPGCKVFFFHLPETDIKDLLQGTGLTISDQRSFGNSTMTMLTYSV